MKKTIRHSILGLILALCGLFSQVATVSAVDTSLVPVDPKSVGSTLEVHIYDNGRMVLHGAQVVQVAGTTFYARSTWGSSSMRWVVRTDDTTRVIRRFGTETTIAEIKVGDILSIEGDFMASSDSLSVVAKKITDWSLSTDKIEFAGTITSIATSTTTFDIKTSAGNKITVVTNGSTSIIKGVIGISFDKLGIGERITSATGVYNHVSRVLTADTIRVYQDKSIFKPRNFEGTLQSLSGQSLPATMTVSVGGKSYIVELPTNTVILNAKKAPTTLKRFFADDKVRFYGAIKQDNLTVIVAEVVRNMDL